MPEVTDAEFTVVSGPQPPKRSLLGRFGRWCLYVVVTTVFMGIFAGVAALIAALVFHPHTDAEMRRSAGGIMIVVLAVGAFVNGFLRGGKQ